MRNPWLSKAAGIVVSTMVGMGCFAADNDGLTLPQKFSATVVHEGQGTARHLDVAASGDIYLAGRDGLSVLHIDKDGKAQATSFGDVKGTEVRLFKNWLYASDDVGVYS